jgi:hypothetical protein
VQRVESEVKRTKIASTVALGKVTGLFGGES